MLLKKLFIQNFLSIRSVEIELDNRGMVLICGENKDNPDFQSNGAGKSTITESLVYVLYGRTIRGLKGDEVVHNISKKNCKVMLDLIDDDGTKYRVARYRKHSQQGNKFFLYCNGKDITPKSEADFTKAIVDLLQMDYMTFTSSILYSASSFKFTSATDSELKSAFDTMLGFELYANCQEEAKQQLKKVEFDFQQTQQENTQLIERKQQLEADLSNAQEEETDYEDEKKAQLAEYDAKIAKIKQQKSTLSNERKAAEKTVEESKTALESAQSAQEKALKATQKIDEIAEEIKHCEGLLSKYDKDISRLTSQLNTSESRAKDCDSVVDRHQAKIEKIRVKMEETTGTVGTPCPTCGAALTEESIETVLAEYKSQIAEIQDEIAEQQESKQQHIAKQEELKKEIEALEKDKEDVQGDLDSFNSVYEKSTKLREKSRKATEMVGDAKAQLAEDNGKLRRIMTELSACDIQIEDAQKAKDKQASEENPYTKYVSKYKSQIAEIEQSLQSNVAKTKAFTDEITCLQFWVQAYSNSGIKSLLLDDITPYLNRQANKYLRKLSSDHMEIRFSTQSVLKTGEKREKFNIEVLNSDGGNTYSANSSGEKKRVDLAVNLALQSLVSSRSNKKLNLIMLDEILDSLDDVGISHTMDLLSELSKERSSIFVISHNDSIKTVFTETLTIVKENGYSIIKGSTEVDEDGNS